jgi:hypothetical protein
VAAAAATADAAAKPAFRPGVWIGTGTQSGTFDLAGEASPVHGTAKFRLVVSRSGVASGRLTLRTTMTVSKYIEGTLTGVATLRLSGTASNVRMSGSIRMSGEVTDNGTSVPFAITKPLSGRLVIGRATCRKVTGKTDALMPFRWSAASSSARC